MIAVDTNVSVRLLTNDDPAQAERDSIFVPKTVLLATECVLRYSYELSPQVVLDAFRRLLDLPDVTAEGAPAVPKALEWYEAGMDCADALHLSSARDAEAFATFDDRVKKRVGRRRAAVRML